MSTPDYTRIEMAARNVAHHAAIASARLDLGRDDELDRRWALENIAKAAAALGYVLAPMMPDPPRTATQVSASLAGAAVASAKVAPASESAA